MELFPTIVSRAKTVQIISSGASGHASGTLQLVSVTLLANIELLRHII